MKHYFGRALRMQVLHAPSLYALSVLGVAIGVASVLSIQIINRNAVSAFMGSVRAISGDADCSILPRTPALDDSLYPRVLAQPDVRGAWPIVQITVTLAGTDVFLDVVGVDLFAPVELPFVSRTVAATSTGEDGPSTAAPGTGGAEDGAAGVLRDALVQPGWIAISPELAAERGWRIGDRFDVQSGSRVVTLQVGTTVEFARTSPLASRRLALMDIAQAQGLLGRRGELDQIDVTLADGLPVGAAVDRLQEQLGPSVLVVAANDREEQVTGLLQAFRLNLTALSLISIFVGVFLIFSSTQAALVRRRTEFGMLRSLGATSGQLLRIVLGEVALLGVLGTGIGLWLGHWIAARNIDVVSGTLTNLYLLSEIERLEMPPSLWVLAAGVGVGGALAGALLPGLDLARRDPFSLLRAFTLHERVSRQAPRLAVLGALLLGLGATWFAVWGRDVRPGGFVLGLVVMLALPCFTPLVVRTVCARIPVRGVGFSLGIRNLLVRLQTTSFAVAALAVAVSMLISVTLLIGSFRRTLATWVDTTIRADVFVTTPSWARAGTDATLDASIIAAMRAHPRVQDVEMLRQFPVYAGERRIRFSGLSTRHPQIAARIPLRDGNPDDVWRAVRTQGACLISEPLARKEGLGVGDTLVVSAPGGPARILIAGVSYDYATDAGAALVDLEVCERLFGPGPINNIALFLLPGSDAGRVIDELRAQFPGAALFLRSNSELRADIFHIFDQTFAITRILQVMALLVAVCGIALTLLVLARERVPELALYGSLGALRTQIFRLFVAEGLSIGVIGLVLGLGGGVCLGLILMYVINPMYFGWTIRPAWPAAAVAQQVATILAAALVASIYPALRASRTPARELSRDL